MLEIEVSEEDLSRVPRLASDCDSTAFDLSPAEGFLLSRIDGQTSWKLLREIGGIMTAAEVDVCVEEWLGRGLIDIDGRAPRVKRRERAIPEPSASWVSTPIGQVDKSLVDTTLELSEAVQLEILEFEAKLELELDYFALLGVNTASDAREIKRAYFKLSKKFHPDRYFRKNVGPYGDKLHCIFKRVSESYELLSDPVSRKEIESNLPRVRTVEACTSEAVDTTGASSKQSAAPVKALSPIERLRQRMPFRVPDTVREEKTAKGAELFKAAELSEKMGRLSEAAANMRLAVAFDPFNKEFKRKLAEYQGRMSCERVEELLASGSGALGENEQRDARRMAEEILLYRPDDAATMDLASRVYLEIEDVERAEEYCERSIELAPKVGAYRRTRALVFRMRGNKGHAVSELQKALDLDSGDDEARELLEALRIKPRRA